MLEIHSRKSQGHRNKVSDQFRNGQGLVMFTSDVSARGMDYPDVSAVIQVISLVSCGEHKRRSVSYYFVLREEKVC